VTSDAETRRLIEAREHGVAWRKWGPYLSERQWGTVREDYSDNGSAWEYFTHDQARSRAYGWGEDGLGGYSDDKQRLCFALFAQNMLEIALELAMHDRVYAGIGASHQTGWTGLVAKLLQLFGTIAPETVLSRGARAAGGLPAPPG
jgi:hypothetical protein